MIQLLQYSCDQMIKTDGNIGIFADVQIRISFLIAVRHHIPVDAHPVR